MLTRQQWTKQMYPFAKKVTDGTGIFPETLLAIAIVESQGRLKGIWYPGASPLARLANNFFGIKRGSGWTGETIRLATPNDADKVSTFRKYPSFEASAKDFVNFLQVNQRYRKAGVFDADSYQEQIISIARAGYAEGTSYADIITKVANSVNKTIKNIGTLLNNTNKSILPLIAIGAIFFLTLQNQSHEKIH